MRKLLFMTFVCLITTGFAQKVDLANAPENPIAFKFKLEHFNLKGDVYRFNSQYYFNKEGFLISKSDIGGDNIYIYENGKLTRDGNFNPFKVNDQGLITYRNGYDYTYNDRGLLLTSTETRVAGYKTPAVNNLTKYVYDAQDRVIKEEKYVSDVLKKTTTYTYKKVGNAIQVFKEITEAGKEPYKNENHYIDGRLVLAKDQYSDIPLIVESKLDAKGNSVEDKHINGGTLTDTFSYTIVYYSDANKPQSYTVAMIKSYDSSMIPQVRRNGQYFSTRLERQLKSTNDMLFYDDLTKTYYLAKNVYDKTLAEGTTIKMELLLKNNEVLMFLNAKDEYFIFDKGQSALSNSEGKMASLMTGGLFVYTKDAQTRKEQTYLFKDIRGKTFVSGEILPENKDQLYYYSDASSNTVTVIFKGVWVKDISKTDFKRLGDFGYLAYANGEPKYVLPEYYNMKSNQIYSGHIFDPKVDTDVRETNANASSDNQNSVSSTDSSTSCVSGNCTEGFGELKTQHSTLTGFFSGGKVNGYGKEVYNDETGYYQGEFRNGQRDGFGMYTWNSDQSYYIGQWKEGQLHGYGYIKKGTQVLQAGYYENGKQTRNLLSQDYINKRAVGNCIGDCQNGFGYYQFSNNDKYVGFFTNGQFNHVGAYTWVSGDVYIGNIRNSEFSGQGILYYKSLMTTYYGNLLNVTRQGLGVYYNKSGNIESKGYWSQGILKTAM